MNNEELLQELRNTIESIAGFKPCTPKDFDTHSSKISEKTNNNVSVSTLKRIWGYLSTDSAPRQSTLDILARYSGYYDYKSFCQAILDGMGSDNDMDGEYPAPTKPGFNKTKAAFLFLLLLAVIGGVTWLCLSHRQTESYGSPRHILKKGQTFATYQDYLTLFSIHAKDTLWGQRLPHHPNISVWGPRYHHHHWHNDGDSALLMPTITERWEPDDGSADSTLIAMRNNDHYYTYRDMNELRITFMQGLTPDGDSLMFCGVYRMDLEHSNTHHVTWMRVAEEVDLSALEYLEELHN